LRCKSLPESNTLVLNLIVRVALHYYTRTWSQGCGYAGTNRLLSDFVIKLMVNLSGCAIHLLTDYKIYIDICILCLTLAIDIMGIVTES